MHTIFETCSPSAATDEVILESRLAQEEFLDEYVLGHLSEDLNRRVEAHLRTCVRCRKLADDTRLLLQALRGSAAH